MSDLCSRVVAKWERQWPIAGWLLWCGYLLAPYFLSAPEPGLAVDAALGLLLLCWWLIDVVDQRVSVWIVLLGVAMIAFSHLPFAGIFFIAAWVAYWTLVRD